MTQTPCLPVEELNGGDKGSQVRLRIHLCLFPSSLKLLFPSFPFPKPQLKSDFVIPVPLQTHPLHYIFTLRGISVWPHQ